MLARLVTVAVVFVTVVLGLLVALWALQRRMIYLPLDGVPPPATAVLRNAQDVTFDTEDGLRLGGWFVAAGDTAGPAILVCNGNAGHRGDRAGLAAALARAGLSVLLFDYRGYAGNPGRPSERGLIADGRAARRWLEARPEVDPRRVVLFGESLGSGVAVALAAERAPAALVLRSPFTSLVDVARLHYPFLPAGSLLRDRFPSIERIAGYHGPLLVIAGDRDTIVPESLSRRLYEAAPGEPRRMLTLPGVGHNDPVFGGDGAMVHASIAFLEQAGLIRPPHTEAR